MRKRTMEELEALCERPSTSELLAHALRVARAMWKDPEAESCAGFAVRRAELSWDPMRGQSLKKWVAICVRTNIRCAMRKKPGTQKSELWWECVVDVPSQEADIGLGLAAEEYQMLYENFVLKWPLDVVARRHGMSRHELRKLFAELKADLATHLTDE